MLDDVVHTEFQTEVTVLVCLIIQKETCCTILHIGSPPLWGSAVHCSLIEPWPTLTPTVTYITKTAFQKPPALPLWIQAVLDGTSISIVSKRRAK